MASVVGVGVGVGVGIGVGSAVEFVDTSGFGMVIARHVSSKERYCCNTELNTRHNVISCNVVPSINHNKYNDQPSQCVWWNGGRMPSLPAGAGLTGGGVG